MQRTPVKKVTQVLKSMLARRRWIFLAAFVVRLAVLVHLWRTIPPGSMWGTNEAGMIARSLLVHHSFGAAFHDYAGPTAWLAPGYPCIVVAVFLVFGIESNSSAMVLMILNAVFASITALLIRALGEHFFDETVGLFAAWAWALCPMGAILSFILWDTSLSALMLCWAVLTLVQANTARMWALSGVTWGLAGLLNPALLAPLPFLLVSSCRRETARCTAWFLICFAMCLVPWTVRNELVLHAIVPIRSNMWAEIYYGNVSFATHPLGTSMEYQKLGEMAYVAKLKRGAVESLRAHPAIFVKESLYRAFLFWIVPFRWLIFTVSLSLGAVAGLWIAFRQIGSRALPLAFVCGCYPLIYCVSYVYSRYRHPIEPFMFLLATFAVCNLVKMLRGVSSFKSAKALQ